MAKKFAEHHGLNLTETNKSVLDTWNEKDIFHRSITEREGCPQFVFFEGPPSANGHPGIHHVLARTIKDTFNRYKTMKGYQVHRKAGWDTHGLPVELGVEKELGITKADIDNHESPRYISTEDYNRKCRENVMMFTQEWRDLTEKMGYFVDLDHPYITYDNKYIETLWWLLKQFYNKGLLYKGYTIQPYSPAAGTGLSSHELNQPGCYRDVKDTTATVQFKIVDPRPEMKGWGTPVFLAWTTTPWTLPSNTALCVGPKIDYVCVQTFNPYSGEKISAVMAAALVDSYLKPEGEFASMEGYKQGDKVVPYRIVGHYKGSDLVGMRFQQLMPWVKPCEKVEVNSADFVKEYAKEHADKCFTVGNDQFVEMSELAFRVIPGDYVTIDDGTGIVHIAPAYGEDDYALAQKYELDFVDCLDENGYYLPDMAEELHALGVRDTDEHGIQAWAGNKFIAKVLEEKGIIYKIEYIQHEYPFNPRSKERIMYRAFPSWFFDIENQKSLMLAENENINWFPEYLKHGRFAKNIEQAPDWNLSRDRFWATAMPVWKGDKGSIKVVGSYDELYELSGKRLEDYHRPWVDAIEFDIDGEHFTRIEKVLDCWFESGSMPFAQLHYPFENKEKFERNYPADFIVEYVGQVRAWFYYVHAVNTALAEIGAFGEKALAGAKNAYKNVITTGTLAGNDGRKMSKSLGNYTDPNILMDQYSADALRFLLLSSPVLSGEDFALLDKDVSDVSRKLAMLWNVYDFFTTYAEIENIDSDNLKLNTKNPLDAWIVSRVYQLRDSITEGMEEYNIPKALEDILPFIDDLSNWFVRRSRRRFSKNEDEQDKMAAFATLYYILIYIAKLLAPFTPFLSEELYQKMTGANESVHLLDWPEAGVIDTEVLNQMSRTRQIITDALALRMQKTDTEDQIKVRQPLSKLVYTGDKLPDFYEQIIMDEVNVKKVENGSEFTLDKTLTEELKREGYARDLIRAIQSARKNAKLNMDDRIRLSLSIDLPAGFEELVLAEVLADSFEKGANYAHDEIAKVSGDNVTISLEKV
jgi:isoleucyl-tRNA synthetase